jgi:acyl-CoA reductase-like NAD-dependent aldehyde dehydrogenase
MATMSERYSMLINGEWVQAQSGATSKVINPANGQEIAIVPKGSAEDVERAVQAAHRAAPAWGRTTVTERSKILGRFSQLIMSHRDELARIQTMEHGSPLRKTQNFDVPLCAEQLEYFAGVVRAMKGETLPVGPWCSSLTVREPLGVVGLITPWNFPALMVVWKMGAALATGNTCVVKPPSIAPLTVLKLGELALEAGIPSGVLNIITGPGGEVGEALVEHPLVAKIGFTGDTSTGKRIMSLASKTVKQVGLELGGKNAFLVLEDADVDAAVEGAIFGAFFNSGQVCAAASRFYVHESLYDAFVSKLVSAAGNLRYGDPMKMETVMGPVAYEGHRDKIEQFVEGAKISGAKLLLGGVRPDSQETRNGYFVAPTIFGECNNSMPLMREEVFGPVIGLARFSTLDEVVSLANDTDFGLSASVWTKDLRVGINVANSIKAGTVWLNEHLIIFCDTPWGGCKQSGWGKDLSTMVLEEYTMTKHIYIDLTSDPVKPWYAILK